MAEISVVVPVYGVEQYIGRCIESILAQTFFDFELILVDDGSTDDSGLICDKYAQTDKRIRVVHQENLGVAVARNRGAKDSTGHFITFIDGDDWVDRMYLECLYKACVENDADIAVMSFDSVIDEKDAVPQRECSFCLLENYEALNKFGVICGTTYRSAVSKLVRAEIVKENPFPINRRWAEDTACIYKWYWAAKKIVEVSGWLYFYYYNQKSVSNLKFDSRYLGELDTFEEMIEFYEREGLDSLHRVYVNRYLETAYRLVCCSIDEKRNDITRIIQKRMRKMLKKYAKRYGLTIDKKTDLYDIVYPNRTRVYRVLLRVFQVKK